MSDFSQRSYQLSRRLLVLGATVTPFGIAMSLSSDNDNVALTQLPFPSIESLANPQPFGYAPPTEAQKLKAKGIVDGTPKGPRPIDVAQSFVDRFAKNDPAAISQWPEPNAWNPLIVEFFSVTTMRPDNDMIPWCAAFANWCLERSSRKGSRNTSSQSFLSNYFVTTDDPKHGDLAIFTCYDSKTTQNLGIGHVTFFKEQLPNGRISVIGGNQSGDGHSSIISEAVFITTESRVRRHIDGKYVVCTMRLNKFVKVV